MTKLSQYVQSLEQLQQSYMDSPKTVSIETYSKCNGKCTFCPYQELDRVGNMMESSTVYRLLDEISSFPADKPVIINLSRVNEPFLDHRLFEFSKYINDNIPFAQLIFFSNGSVLSQEKIYNISNIKNINFLNISFNDYRENEYEKIMGLSYRLVRNNLDFIHESIANNLIRFPVKLSRVGDGTEYDINFEHWVKTNYPSFRFSVSTRSNWMGAIPTSAEFLIPDAGCPQWFNSPLKNEYF